MQRVDWLVILLVLFPSSPSPSASTLASLCIAPLVDTLGLASAGAGSDSKHALQLVAVALIIRPRDFFRFFVF
jgi:hypothetical protein